MVSQIMPFALAVAWSFCILPESYCLNTNGDPWLIHSRTMVFSLKSDREIFFPLELGSVKLGAGLPTSTPAWDIENVARIIMIKFLIKMMNCYLSASFKASECFVCREI